MAFLRCVDSGSRSVLALAVLASLFVAANVDAGTSTPPYSLTDLGALPPALPNLHSFSSATAINDSGQVVGYSNTGSTPTVIIEQVQHAFVSNGGNLLDLGVVSGVATGINASATIVGSTGEPIGDSTITMVYPNGTFHNFGITSPNARNAPRLGLGACPSA